MSGTASGFLPSDRWGRNITNYTSDTKKREQVTSVLSLGALGCFAIIAAALAYTWLFPSVGVPLLDSAGRMAEEMQGLRQQNALLRAHLERLVHVHERRLRNENQEDGQANSSDAETLSSTRKLLASTASLEALSSSDSPEDPSAVDAFVGAAATGDQQVGVSLQPEAQTSTAWSQSAQRPASAAADVSEGAEDGGLSELISLIATQLGTRLASVWVVGQGMASGIMEVSGHVLSRVFVSRPQAPQRHGKVVEDHEQERIRAKTHNWRNRELKADKARQKSFKKQRALQKQSRKKRNKRRL